MYILPEEIKRRVFRRYRKRSREIVVDERFRGWAWELPPIDPPYDITLGLSSITSRYCPSMRDIYLKYVENKRGLRNIKMVEGSLYHAIAAAAVENAKRLVYVLGKVDGNEFGTQMNQISREIIGGMIKRHNKSELITSKFELGRISRNMQWIWDHSTNQIITALQNVLTTQPYIGLDALVNTAIPVVVEQRLDGKNIGLSGHLSSDAFGVEGIVVDIKTGQKRRFHRLATTGYAMVIESIHEYPVDVGCILYCQFGDTLPPHIEYDVHTIDESLRMEFLEMRDAAMKLVFDQMDPGMPEKCYDGCQYWDDCH